MYFIFPMLVSSIAGARMALAAQRAARYAKQQQKQAGADDAIDVEARFIDDLPALPAPTTLAVAA